MAIPTRSKVRFRERAELLDFLLEASRLTSETLDLDRLLDNVARIVRDVVPYDLFAILLYSERTQGLSIRYSIGHREEVVRTLVISLHEGIVGEAAATRSAVLVEDVRNDPRYLNAMDAVRSELAVPMVARGKLVGVLDVQSTRLKAFSGHERALLSLIGSRVAGSIDNARLYRRLDRQNRTLRTLAHLSQEFSSILDLDELLGKIAATVRALINYDAFSIFLVDAQHRVLRHRFSVRYDQRVNLDNIPLGKGLTGAAAETREAVRVLDTATDPRYIASHPDIRSELAVPLVVQDRVVGVLDLESDRVSYFTEDHQRTLTLLAPQIASSVENARLYEELTTREQRMEQDLKAARKVQRVLLPRTAPELRGLEIALRSRPAREISGDVYDFFEYDDGDAVIVFGDVSGKGAAAALYGAMVSGLMRILAPRRRSPAQLMKSLNEILLERKVDAQYATMLVALWRPAERKLVFANAGAEPPLVWRAGQILKPKVEGVPIGLLDDREYEEVTFPVLPGDTILFYSDGVEDQLNAGDENYSRSRLTLLLERQAASSQAMGAPQAVVDAIFDDLDAFRSGTAITDDQTAVVIKVHQ
ncbi:MAG TPA: GAF domain-containing SpoIIE family protein phosphatase [Bryobacteraceae bacterium]|nr:GAF domain-containing SpoIIE family protein phosphatase [Bryobacteraceae bacterium]